MTVFFRSCDGHARWSCPVARDALNDEGMHIPFWKWIKCEFPWTIFFIHILWLVNTGNKEAACGPQSTWGFGAVTTLTLDVCNILILKYIIYLFLIRANFNLGRIYLSCGWSISSCNLRWDSYCSYRTARHIPHWDASSPNYANESSFQPYHMTVNIPDVYCAKCSLQMLYIMTDKTVNCGELK